MIIKYELENQLEDSAPNYMETITQYNNAPLRKCDEWKLVDSGIETYRSR